MTIVRLSAVSMRGMCTASKPLVVEVTLALELIEAYNEAVSTIKVDNSQFAVNLYYTLAVKLKSNSKFKLGDHNTVLFHISLLPIPTSPT